MHLKSIVSTEFTTKNCINSNLLVISDCCRSSCEFCDRKGMSLTTSHALHPKNIAAYEPINTWTYLQPSDIWYLITTALY